uniref:Nudix hydrolase domain-containing protein n=1 Tax=Pseudomonas phage Nican01 TaxID=3138540 RepID=A0AAU6W0K7_9CAUD
MKPQFIVGIKNETLTEKVGLPTTGLSPIDMQQIIELVQEGIVIGQREALEKDESVRQVLPYVILSQFDESAGVMKYIPYRRTKLVGESRLAGNVSVGFGGHIDLDDVVSKGSVVDLIATIGQAVGRELQEEVIFSGMDGADISLFSVGMILDNSDEVGKVHLGVVMNAQLPPGATAVCAEEELESLRPMTARELLDSGLPIESWSRIALDFLYQVEQLA